MAKGVSFCILDGEAPAYMSSAGLNVTWFFQEFAENAPISPDWLKFPYACNCANGAAAAAATTATASPKPMHRRMAEALAH